MWISRKISQNESPSVFRNTYGTKVGEKLVFDSFDFIFHKITLDLCQKQPTTPKETILKLQDHVFEQINTTNPVPQLLTMLTRSYSLSRIQIKKKNKKLWIGFFRNLTSKSVVS